MGFDLTIHWAQMIGTVASGAAVFAVASASLGPYFRRRAVRKETELKAGIREIVEETITASDKRTETQITEVKVLVAAVQLQANKTDLALASEFGGNSGGFRQELNTLRDSVGLLAGKFEGYLSGKGASSG